MTKRTFTDFDAVAIRADYISGMTIKEIIDECEVDVSRSTISRIVNNKTYKNCIGKRIVFTMRPIVGPVGVKLVDEK